MGRTTALRSLHLSTYPNIVEMNIPNLLRQQFNLRSLWINAPEPQKETSSLGTITYKSITVSDLRKEMTGPLPHKLQEITIAGKGFTSIADNIFKVIENVIWNATCRNAANIVIIALLPTVVDDGGLVFVFHFFFFLVK